METFLFWTVIIAFVCGCSLGYDTVIDFVRQRSQPKKTEPEQRSQMTSPSAADFVSKRSPLPGKDIIRGYDTPELFYQDTLMRIHIGGTSGTSPANLQ